MRNEHLRGLVAIIVLLCALTTLVPGVEAEEWCMFRKDIWHTGFSNATGNFSGVELLWKFNTGSWVLSSPSVADLDGDGRTEIVFGAGNGKLYVLGRDGAEIWNRTLGAPAEGVPEWARADIRSSPALSDVDDDDDLEFIVTTSGKVYAFDDQGTELWSFCLSAANSSGGCGSTWATNVLRSSPMVADINNDTISEIVFGTGNGSIYVLNSTGSELWARPYESYVSDCGGTQSTRRTDTIASTPALADLDGDDQLEIIFQTAVGGQILAYHPNGTLFWNTSHYIGSSFGSPAIGDINDDGALEIVTGAEYPYYLHAFSSDGERLWSFETGGAIESSPAIAEQGANIAIVFGCSDGYIYCVNSTGDLSWRYSTNNYVFSSPALADLDGDRDLDVVIGSGDGRLYAIDDSGERLFAYQTNGAISASPAVADITGDGIAEIIFGSNDGNLYVLTFAEPAVALIPRDITVPDVLVEADTAIVSAIISNSGTIDANDVIVEFFDNDVPIGNETIDLVPVNGNERVYISWMPTAGEHIIKATAGSKNIATNISVQKRTVDLSISYKLYIYGDEGPNEYTNKISEGDLTYFRFTVNNLGNAKARDVNVKVYVDDEFYQTIELGDIISYRSGHVDWRATSGTHTIRFVVEKVAYETNEGNNVVSITLDVQKKGAPNPHLIISCILGLIALMVWISKKS